MAENGKPLIWLSEVIKTPPFSREGRLEAGYLLRRLQLGENLGMPFSRPMPSIGVGVHELRIPEASKTWRIIYKPFGNAVLIVSIFVKKSQATPKTEIDLARLRLKKFFEDVK